MYNKDRTLENKRVDELEKILSLLNNTLMDDEEELTHQFKRPQQPVLFIVGNARSGTTLLYQWLASTGLFSYPSNIISRFYKAPYIGALIHKMFVDHDKFGELLGKETLSFESSLGKTQSPVSPHEFWYFWRRFFDFGEIQKLDQTSLAAVDSETFAREIAALEAAFDKPLVLKGMILNWNLRFLKKIIPNAFFLHISRQEIFNMESLYRARIKYFGNVEKWYSFKPPEYTFLKEKDVYGQLAGQVIYTNKAIRSSLNVNLEDSLAMRYEEFCRDPQQLFSQLKEKLNRCGCNIEAEYEGPSEFEVRNEIADSAFEVARAKKALKEINL